MWMYIFLLVYANNNFKKKYKEKVLSLAKIDFEIPHRVEVSPKWLNYL